MFKRDYQNKVVPMPLALLSNLCQSQAGASLTYFFLKEVQQTLLIRMVPYR